MSPTPPISDSRETADQSARPQNPPWLYKRVGRYQLQALLGEGSNGRVFRAEDLQLARQIALKIFSLASGTRSPTHTIEQAVHEAKLAAGLEHPHIVHVYEVNETSNVCYIAMELVEGGNLKDLVRSSGPMDYRRACQIAAEIAEALAFAHERGVIHRDVKPANLMLSATGRCKLADFGLAVLNTQFGDRDKQGVAGTPQFIAPELINGESASRRSDIYSLGATLWFLLTANPPFSADSVAELLDKQLNDPLPDLTRLRPEVPRTLAQAIGRAMEKDPALRYENAEQFAGVLRVHTIPVGAATASSLANLGMFAPAAPVRIRKAILWGGLAATFAVLAAGAVVYWMAGGWSKPPENSPTSIASDQGAQAHPNMASAKMNASLSQPSPTTAATILSARDTPALTALASQDPDHAAPVTVEGIVTSNQISKHAKTFRIGFDGSDDASGFVCLYKPELLPALQAKFGSTDGLGLAGKRIHVTGRVEIYKDRPALRIDSVDQIEVVK